MATNAGTAYVEIVGDFSKLNTQIAAATGPLTSKFGKLGKAASVGLAGVAVGVGLATKELYDLGSEFDNAYDTIRQTTGKSGKELEKLKRDFRAVVASVPADFGDASEAIAELNQRLGVTGKPLRQVAKQLLELSRMTGTDLGNNIRQVARAFKDWEVPVRRQAATLDGFFRLSQKTGIAVGDLAESVVRFGAPLRNFGFTLGQTSAMFSEFEQSGVNMTTLMSGLRLATGNLAKPTADLTKRLQQLGLATAEPQQQFLGVVDAIENTKSRTEALSIAIDVFGKRAANDLVEAVKQGRFNLDDLIGTMEHGRGTILGTAKSTRDTAENMKILGNRLKLFVEPAATAVFKAVGALSRILVRLTGGNFRDLQKALGLTRRDMRALGNAIRVVARIVGDVFAVAFAGARQAIKSFLQGFRGAVGVIRGIVRLIASILRGDFGAAWRAVKEIFRNSLQALVGFIKATTVPIRQGTKAVGQAMIGVFRGVWGTIKDIFGAGADAVIAVVNAIIDAINVIPGVPDIDKIGGTGLTSRTRTERGQRVPQARYSGGAITRPMAIVGEEAPRHHEWVIATNPAYRQNNLAYWAQAGRDLGVPGFFSGGDITNVVTAPFKAAGSLLGKGASYFIGRLPKPDLPNWLAGLGTYLINQVSDWITSGFKSGDLGAAKPSGAGAGRMRSYPGLSGDTDFSPILGRRLSKMAMATKTHISVTSGFRSRAEQAQLYAAYLAGTGNLAAPPGSSNHESGLAADISPGRETFGSRAGTYSLGFTVPSESWHIEALRRGGLMFRKRGGRLPAWVHGRKSLNNDQLASLAHYVGMAHPALMGQIAMGESSGNPLAVGDGGASIGLWQIHTGYHPQYSKSALRDPLFNARAALSILNSEGIGAWHASPTGPKGTISPLGALGGGGGGGGPSAAQLASRAKQREYHRRIVARGAKIKELYRKVGNRVRSAGGGIGLGSRMAAMLDVLRFWHFFAPDDVYKGAFARLDKRLEGVRTTAAREATVRQMFRLSKKFDPTDEIAGAPFPDLLKARGTWMPGAYSGPALAARRREREALLKRLRYNVLNADTPDKKLAALGKVAEFYELFGIFSKAERLHIRGLEQRMGSPTVRGLRGIIEYASAHSAGISGKPEDVLNKIGASRGPKIDQTGRITNLRELLRQTRERLAVSQAQYGVLPGFARGGIVPGPPGAPMMAITHGREGVFTPEQMAALGDRQVQVTVNVLDGAVDPAKIEVIADQRIERQNRRAGRKAARTLPSRAGIV